VDRNAAAIDAHADLWKPGGHQNGLQDGPLQGMLR
jgi:hypothetical protein